MIPLPYRERDDREKEVALLDGGEARLQGRLIRINRHRSFVRHPDLVAESSEQGIDLIEQLPRFRKRSRKP